MDFDQLLHFSDPYHIDITLVFTTANSDIIYLAHSKDVALRHDAIQDVESECIDQVQHLFFRADEKHVVDYEGVSHVLDVQGFDFAGIATFENINFVLRVHNQDMIFSHSIHMACRLP